MSKLNMETTNANLHVHRDVGGSEVCTVSLPGESAGDKITDITGSDVRLKKDPSLASHNANDVSRSSTDTSHIQPNTTVSLTSREGVGATRPAGLSGGPREAPEEESRRQREHLSNGMEYTHSPSPQPAATATESSPPGVGSVASNLVNNPARGETSPRAMEAAMPEKASPPPGESRGGVSVSVEQQQQQAELSNTKPTELSRGPHGTVTGEKEEKSGATATAPAVASVTPEDGVKRSDPSTASELLSISAAGESRSCESLESSFTNLHSCPSSSDGLDDNKDIALTLQSEHESELEVGADGLKVALLAGERERGGAGQSVYHIKWIRWQEENTPVITQNENGPCPLLAIMNVLLLAWKVKMPPMMEIITAEQLMEYLGDYILETKPKEITEAQRLNYEQNMSDAMAVLHKLQTGLDVNVKFTGVRVFEYTPECLVFDLLDIPLYHGWLLDPQCPEVVSAVGSCSYNQLVEKIINCKQAASSTQATQGLVAEQFLSSTATQLTYHGLCELTASVQEGELGVFFRNNHFSTMTKYKGQLYLLVTDQGFLTEERVVWESLHNVDGDGNFCDSDFHLRPPSDPETVYHGQQDQIDQDYLMALSLQQEQQGMWEELGEGAGPDGAGLSDLELAKKLQEEEDRRASQYYQEQEQAQAQAAGGDVVDGAAAAAGGGDGGGGGGGGGGAGGGEEGSGAADAAPAGATGGSQSPQKQHNTHANTQTHGPDTHAHTRKTRKEPKDKDKCVIL